MNDITPEEAVVIAMVDAAPLAHAHAVFDLIHTHEGAGTRGIDPMIVERHRRQVTDAILANATAILGAEVGLVLPARVTRGRRVFARGRIQTAIAQLLHHTHLAMIEAGLSTRRQMVALAAPRAMFAAEIASDILRIVQERDPDIVDDLERRSVAA